MRSFQDGNDEAYGVLLKRLLPTLMSIARARLSDKQMAEDAVQEALIRIYKQASKFRGESKVKSWAHRIVLNACIDEWRKEDSRTSLNVGDEALAVRSTNSDDFAQKSDTQIVIRNALFELPLEQSEPMRLLHLEGRSYEEVSKMLEIPLGTVKSRCDRGRKALAEILKDLNPRLGNQMPSQSVQVSEVKNADK